LIWTHGHNLNNIDTTLNHLHQAAIFKLNHFVQLLHKWQLGKKRNQVVVLYLEDYLLWKMYHLNRSILPHRHYNSNPQILTQTKFKHVIAEFQMNF